MVLKSDTRLHMGHRDEVLPVAQLRIGAEIRDVRDGRQQDTVLQGRIVKFLFGLGTGIGHHRLINTGAFRLPLGTEQIGNIPIEPVLLEHERRRHAIGLHHPRQGLHGSPTPHIAHQKHRHMSISTWEIEPARIANPIVTRALSRCHAVQARHKTWRQHQRPHNAFLDGYVDVLPFPTSRTPEVRQQ